MKWWRDSIPRAAISSCTLRHFWSIRLFSRSDPWIVLIQHRRSHVLRSSQGIYVIQPSNAFQCDNGPLPRSLEKNWQWATSVHVQGPEVIPNLSPHWPWWVESLNTLNMPSSYYHAFLRSIGKPVLFMFQLGRDGLQRWRGNNKKFWTATAPQILP